MSATLLADLANVRSVQAVVDGVVGLARTFGAPYAFLHADSTAQFARPELEAEPFLPFYVDRRPNAEEQATCDRLRYVEHASDRWLTLLPDVYWGMWLGPSFVEAAGGLSTLLQVPAHMVVGQEDGSVYIQLTADPANVRRPEYAEQVLACRRVMAPVLLPPYEARDPREPTTA